MFVALAMCGCAAPSRPPQFIGGADLVYPPAAQADGIEGLVVVRYDVTAEGRVQNAVVVDSQPPDVFEQAALAAVRSWIFRPQLSQGEAVPALGRVSEVRFQIGDGEAYSRLLQARTP